jgi:hypothetical protein
VAYFVVPWYDIAHGLVPSIGLVENCVQGMGGAACGTTTESWRVVNKTTSVHVTRSLVFERPITGASSISAAR